MVPKYLTLTTIAFRKFEHALGKNWPFGQENLFCPKKYLRVAYFCVHASGLPDFGRLWSPNPWHQANFSGIPEILRVWRLKWALCKVTRNHLIYTIPIKKLSKSRLSDPFLGLFLVISEIGRLQGNQILSVLGDFNALNHFVCHRYS